MPQLEKDTPFLLFLFTLCFAPLAFGAIEAWSMATVELLICSTAVLYFFQIRKIPTAALKVPGILPLGLLIVWMCIQLIPLPPVVVQIIAPGTYQVYEPILSVGDSSQWIPITVSQKASSLELLRISSYGLFYILTIQLLSTRILLTKTVQCVVLLAVFISFLLIIQKVTSLDISPWFKSPPSSAETVGSWGYNNHYVGLMGMLWPLALALFFYYRPTIKYDETLRARMTDLFTIPSSKLHIFCAIGVIIIVSSAFFSTSPDGMISMSLTLILFFFLQARKKTDSGIQVVTISCAILLAVSWFGKDLLVENFNYFFLEIGAIQDARVMLWQDAWRIILDFLITGSGFGTFIHVYPQYRTIPGTLVFDHAYNDYIELFTDGGLIGFYLAAWFVLAVVVHGWKRIMQRRDRYAILVTIGSLTGIGSITLHSMTNFNMHIGANGLYFFFACGLLVSAGNTRLHYRTRSTFLHRTANNRNYLFLVTGLLLFCGVILLHGGGFLAAKNYRSISSIYLNEHLSEKRLLQIHSAVTNATKYDPLEGFYPSILGKVEYYLHNPDGFLQQYSKAVRLDPLNGEYLQNLGLFLSASSQEKSDMLLAEGYERAIYKDKLILTWAKWLLRSGERQKAIAVMQKGTLHYPDIVYSLTPFFIAYSFSREEISAILPESTAAWMYLGEFMKGLGELTEVEYYLSHGLKYLDREKSIKPVYFDQLYIFYCLQNQKDKAVTILRLAIEWLPNHAPFHVSLGDYYKEEGISYRARQEYEQALLLEPGNKNILNKLNFLDRGGVTP